MKKWMAGALGLVVAAGFAGCGGTQPATPKADENEDRPSMNLEGLNEQLQKQQDAAPAGDAGAEAPSPAEPAAGDAGASGPAGDADAGAAAPAPAADAAAATAPGETDPQHAALIGTTWMIGDVEATFKDGDTVSLKGGPLAMIAPDGLDGDYTYTGGKNTISAMGQTREGTWDGTALIVDGTTGTKK